MRRSAIWGLLLGLLLSLLCEPLWCAEIKGWPKYDKEGPVGLDAGGRQVPPRVFRDLDGNGRQDCMVIKGTGIAVFEKGDDSNWMEKPAIIRPEGTAQVVSIAAGDTDGDGRQELIFGTAQGEGNDCRVYVFEYNNENKAFLQSAEFGPYPNKSRVRQVKVIDANMDGKPEILVTHAYGSQSYARLYSSPENDKWREVWKVKTAEESDRDRMGFRYPNTAVTADLNANGKPEIYLTVQSYDLKTKTCHGWLYAYEMRDKLQDYRYELIWSSNDMGGYLTELRLVRKKGKDKKLIAVEAQLPIPPSSPVCWALFGFSAEENTYFVSGVETVNGFNEFYEECKD